MASRQQTQVLALLVIASAIACGFAWSFLNTSRDRATASQRDRAICLTELEAIQVNAPTAGGPGSTDDAAINRRLRGAATAARLVDQLVSIDPGSAVRVRDSDYMRTPIFLRLNAVSLKQLVGFLYELSVTDNTLRTSDIELSPPLAMPPNRADPSDLWTADVTLSYLSYQQRQPPESR